MDKLAINGGKPVIGQELKKYNTMGDREKDAAVRVIESGTLSDFLGTWGDKFYGGEKVKEFEKSWAALFKSRYAVSFNSATSALYASIGALGIGPGDEVIVSPYTMSASATAILVFNGIPVFADIDENTFNITSGSIKDRITDRTKAIMIPNIFGLSADYESILKIAEEYDLKIIEDNAQAPLAQYKGKYTGTIGDIGVFSLNYHKHIHTGEGGVAITDDGDLADRLMLIRNHAEAVVEAKGVDNIINMIGFNFRLGEIEAAIGLEQLKKLNDLVKTRKNIADKLTEKLSDLDKYIKLPYIPEKSSHVYYVYPIKYIYKSGPHRDKIVDALIKEGVPLGKGYIKPLYLQPIYQKLTGYGDKGCPFKCPMYSGKVNYDKGLCPTAERMYEEELILFIICSYDPCESDIEKISEAFHKVFTNINDL